MTTPHQEPNSKSALCTDLAKSKLCVGTSRALRELADRIESLDNAEPVKEVLEEWNLACHALSDALKLARAQTGSEQMIMENHRLHLVTQPVKLPSGVFIPAGTPLEVVERVLIEDTLSRVGENKTRTAEILGITARTISNKFHQWRSYDARGLAHPPPINLRCADSENGLEQVSFDFPVEE